MSLNTQRRLLSEVLLLFETQNDKGTYCDQKPIISKGLRRPRRLFAASKKRLKALKRRGALYTWVLNPAPPDNPFLHENKGSDNSSLWLCLWQARERDKSHSPEFKLGFEMQPEWSGQRKINIRPLRCTVFQSLKPSPEVDLDPTRG